MYKERSDKMITKQRYLEWIFDQSNTELNKEMIDSFPFLLPHNRWTHKAVENFDYSYNELFGMCKGWLIAFGYEMCCELKEALIKANFLDNYVITDIKEKYGTLRWYDNGCTEEMLEIISKYSSISAKVCQCCGAPATYETKGWIGYYCERCGSEYGAMPIEITDTDFYPITIIKDRYNGTYSGAAYLAFNLDYNEVPVEVSGSDNYCAAFWKTSSIIVGKGSTVIDAYEDLLSQLEDY